MEFRHTKNLINRYEAGIQQIALNNTNQFLEEISAISLEAVKKLDAEKQPINQVIESIQVNPLVKEVYLVDN